MNFWKRKNTTTNAKLDSIERQRVENMKEKLKAGRKEKANILKKCWLRISQNL